MKDNERVHPYIPNSVPAVKAEMLKEIGVADIEELYEDIPEEIRFRGEMNIPEGVTSEYQLKRKVGKILKKNSSCSEYLSFLGGGCYQHHVPAVCSEVIGRSEFLTAYAGEPYEDHGRFQALFEYESLMGELLNMDVVNVPTYDWGQAASTSVRMAARITGRNTVLVSDTVSPDRLQVIRNYCEPVMRVVTVSHCNESGRTDLTELKGRMNDTVAGFYFENPAFTGVMEDQLNEIASAVHSNGGLLLVGVDPVSLGVITPPADYGADIVCGDIQALGNNMHFGGALAGFIATRDEEKFVMEFPSRLFGICKTEVEGEWGFGDVAYDRTSFGVREDGKEFIGTAAALYGISAAVYLSLMGPEGMREIGQTIIQKNLYAKQQLEKIEGVKIRFTGFSFKEFTVDFTDTGKTVKEVNNFLLEKGIFGGHDLETEMPQLKNCALYAFTEIHSKEDIDLLVTELDNFFRKGGK